MDNLKDTGPRDRARIAMNEEWEVSWWTEKFRVSKEQLQEAVDQVGHSVQMVEEYFIKNK